MPGIKDRMEVSRMQRGREGRACSDERARYGIYDGNVLCLDYITVNIMVLMLCYSLQAVTIGSMRVKGTRDLTILFFSNCIGIYSYLKTESTNNYNSLAVCSYNSYVGY